MRRSCTTISVCLLAALFAAPGLAQQRSSSPAFSEGIWTWSGRCHDGQALGLSIRLQGKAIYRGQIPICRGNTAGEDGRAAFSFSRSHLFQGTYRTRANDRIEGDIWQAGGEANALIIGVSFMTAKQVLLNSLHVALPQKVATSQLDSELFITTYPVTAR